MVELLMLDVAVVFVHEPGDGMNGAWSLPAE
jgi:hypothetical protein